jgi:hypothetical protein
MHVSQPQLFLHCGAGQFSRKELDLIEAPPSTRTWYPIKHATVLNAALSTISDAGFSVKAQNLAIAHQGHRFFATLDIDSAIVEGVSLAVGVRNSTDKSFPLGFCCGTRVFVCDNLAFSSEHVISRKHTRFGQQRYGDAIAQVVGSLRQYQAVEAKRIEEMQNLVLRDEDAESKILRSFERGIVSTHTLPHVLREWREPSYEAFRPRTAWSLLNCFTTVLGSRANTSPANYARQTIRLQQLLTNGHEESGEAHEVPQPVDALTSI